MPRPPRRGSTQPPSRAGAPASCRSICPPIHLWRAFRYIWRRALFMRPSIIRILLVAFVALLLNSAYLWAFADPTLSYFVQVALHPVLGLALAAAAVWAVVTRRLRPPMPGLAGIAVAGVGLALGIAVLVLGATTPYRAIVNAHVAASAAGAALILASLVWPRTAIRVQPDAAMARAAVAVVLIAASVAVFWRIGRVDRWRAAYRIENPVAPPSTMDEEGAGPTSPFYPSSATTNVKGIIPSTFF